MAFGADAGFTAYLVANGLTLPAGAPAPAVLRQRGSAYINGLYGPDFSGVPTDGFAQEDSWPRVGAEAYGQAIPSDMIPVAVINASYAAGYQEAVSPGSLSIAASGSKSVKRKKIDVIETEFFEGSGDALKDSTIRLQVVEGLLAPFFAVSLPAIFVV
jgi:hypothetical protein